ncbi:MAG TPA: DUF805 domain-containing protein [Microbacterium sp.]|uniref:DUF805 domain-containing protein n=1 Tax=Microbacterium sp. TaxID=51671 RepID=UPI002CFD5AC5|nr:DUF805 domain-containing protein [Microbacterium sp.]HWI30390.1 DUF805 domain-containing protein [Microbacterium sp.]
MSYTAPPPPADWYPDPHGGSYLRWWNGIAWTEQTKPHSAQAALPAAEHETPALNPTSPTVPYATYPGAPAVSPGAVVPYAPHGVVAAYPPHAPYPQHGGVAAYGIPYDGEQPIGAWRSRADDRPYIRGMGDAIRVVFQKYATFEGRATRSEFWYWYLFVSIVVIGSVLISWIPLLGALLVVGIVLFALAVLIPNYAVAVRRLRDAGYHWAFLLLALVPFGGIALFVMWCQPSKHP